jgi:hypothetical protein
VNSPTSSDNSESLAQDGAEINAWLQKHLSGRLRYFGGQDGKEFVFKDVAPRVHCVLGGDVSIQAGEHTYSTPRDNKGPWTHVEVGFPHGLHGIEEILGDGEDPGTVETVWPYMPIEKVIMLLMMNGGVKRDSSEES